MKKLLILIFIGLGLCSLAQTAKPQLINYYPRNIVSSIVPDGDSIWVGTYDGGVYQCDLQGTILQYFNNHFDINTSNRINCIAIDKHKNKWLGIDGGVLKFDGTNWTDYTISNGLINLFVKSIAIDAQGNKWFGTEKGVSKFDGINWTNYTTTNGLVNNEVYSIAIDAQGNKWFGTGEGVSKFDGIKWTNYTTAEGLVGYTIYSITIDAQGNIWFGTDSGVSKFDGTNWTTYTTDNGLVSNNVNSISIDTQGNKWFGTDSGVSKFDDSNWTSYTTDNGLANQNVNSIAIDVQGNKWFGTDNGISKFDNTHWSKLSTTNGMVDISVNSVTSDDKGNKWFVTDKGISKFDGYNWTNFTPPYGSSIDFFNSIIIDAQGNKWIGTNNGVSKFNDSTWINYTTFDGIVSSIVFSFAIDGQGNKWIGTDNGISKFDDTIWKTYTTNDGLTNNTITSIAIDVQGNKWFGTWGSGILKFDGINWITYTIANGLVDNHVRSITIDLEGNKWIGTNNGISKFDDTNWTTYTTANGLVCNKISSLTIDAKGYKWYGIDNGIAKFDDFSSTSYLIKSISQFNYINSIFIDDQENKWLGTYYGVSVFNENGVELKTNNEMDNIVKISGQLFYDNDKNGQFSTNDYFIKRQKVILLPNNITTFTNYKGEYFFNVDSGKTYTVQIIPQSPYYKGTQELSYQVKATNKDTILPNIALWGKDTISFNSMFTAGIHRCGMKVPFYYTFRNNGTHPANALIAIAIDNKDSIIKTIPTADSVGSDGRLFWKYNNIPVSDDRQVQLQLLLPTGTLDTLLYKAEVLYKDSVASSASLYLPTKCSYDPNDKQVTPLGVNKEKLTLKNEDLQFTIRFQNTGNDYAYDVKILDTLSSQLDWSTFAVTASSHKLRTELSAKGLVTFFFDNIMLPDSATNYIGSNGFVCYTIKPKSSVTENTKIHNTAHIIFDQNPAVVTNTTLNTLVSTLPCSQTENQLTRFAASKFVFNGQTYIKAGTFSQNLINANGCDSIIRLKLVLTDIVGDINGNGTIESPELAGDFNGNGKIDGTEKLGDINGDGIINNKELLGDSNGNGIIDKDELTGIIEIDGCSVSLYPIPVIDKLTIQLKDACNPSSISIVNALGQTVYSNSKPEGQSIVVDMNGMAKGSYVVQIVVEGKSYLAIMLKE